MAGEAVAQLRCCSSCRAVYRSDFTRCPSDGALLALVDTDPLLGAVIGEHYVIDAYVGEGAMGRVYRAHHRRLEQRTFAVKVMLGDWAATMAMRLRFAHEAETASRLSHPHVVPVVDFGRTDEGLLYLAMEYVDGRSLSRVIEDDGPLSADRVIRLARQMCLGLGHAHSLGLVHRDFKPDNVLVVEHDGAELARIVDFGLAISRDVDADVRLTAAGISVGTPIYAAPEQTAGDPNVDHRADLFSLGVSLYEMLAGTPPFDGNVIELIHHNAMGDPPPMALRGRVEVAPALEQLVRRLMSPAPADRYATAAAVIEALDQISTPVPVPASPSTPVGGYPSQSTPLLVAPRRRTFAGLIASVVGLVVTAATVMGMRSPASTAVPTASTTSATTEIAELPAPVPPTTPSHRVASALLPALPPAVSKPEPVVGPSAQPARPRGGARPVLPAVRAPANRGSAALPEMASALPETASALPETASTPPRLDTGISSSVAELPPEPPVASPPPPLPTLPVPTPPARPPPMIASVPKPLGRAAARFDSLTVRGSLATSDVRRALDRVQPALVRCYEQLATAAAAVVATRFTIDEAGKIGEVRIGGATPGLASCVNTAVTRLRPQSPPDVGTVAVSFDLTFDRRTP